MLCSELLYCTSPQTHACEHTRAPTHTHLELCAIAMLLHLVSTRYFLGDPIKDVNYFKHLVQTNADRLESLAAQWDQLNEDTELCDDGILLLIHQNGF